jgi:hypothetical protein
MKGSKRHTAPAVKRLMPRYFPSRGAREKVEVWFIAFPA